MSGSAALSVKAVSARRKAGRKRDDSRDAVILDAALDVLAGLGYEGTTVDLVAARAGAARATVYRRWPSKVELVRAAVERLGPGAVAPETLPDTGSLREDLMAASTPESAEEAQRRVAVISGLQAAASREPALASLVAVSGVGTWVEVNRMLIQRAVDREGLIGLDLDVMSQVLPLMCASRVAMQQQPITSQFVLGVIDGVLLPAMAAGRSRRRQQEPTE